jgi:CHAT domain
MAIISAFGVHGQDKEWDYLQAALVTARGNGLDVRLKLLVGDPSLRKKIDEGIAAGLDWVEVSHIDKTGNRVTQEITKWEPNIVHFFCHGRSDGGEQWIELATGSDYEDTTATSGTVRIGTRDLVALSITLANPWLLTLNCCDSGHATEEIQSMALRVVSAGFPAAVAMLEPVDASDAHEFTRAFYKNVFASLARTHTELAVKEQAPFEWVGAMYDARIAIRDLHGDPENTKEWTLPLLYVRGIDPLNFLRPHADLSEQAVNDYKKRAQTAAEFLQLIADDTDETKRQAIMEKTLKGVPKKFWPTSDGTFDDAS